jgi:hypothetical protein
MNVYYLPSRPTTALTPIEPEWPSFGTRLRNAWWRIRLSLVEVRALLRRRPRFTAELSDFSVPAAPRPSRPAQVIDFEDARHRLRPATGG